MKPILKFLIEAGKLKKMPRTGFVWLGIKNPETIAQHLFRVAILNWVLAKEAKNLDLTKVIQISLVHDLCEVYAGDVTPYWGLLPHDKEKRKEILTRWVRLPKKIKEQRDEKKFAKEKESLKKLVKRLNPRLKEEITNCWFEYEKMLTKEGRFVKQGDKIETLLQAIEYWGANLDSPVLGWWEEVRELTDNPFLLQFLTKIEDKFYKKQKSSAELDFLLKIGKLKTMPRTGWVLRGVSNPETIAEHTFLSTIASWVFAEGRGLNLGKVLKMNLVYEICEVYAGDITPYHGLLSPNKRQNKEILKRWPRFLEKEKEKRFSKDYNTEKKALERLTAGITKNLREEIITLWDDCKKRRTQEGNFVNQVYWLTTYLQALQYFEKNKKFPIFAWYEQAGEYINDLELLELCKEMEKRFLSKKLTFSLPQIK